MGTWERNCLRQPRRPAPAGTRASVQACVSTHACTYRSVHSESTDWPPSPNRPCPGSVKSPSCRPYVPALGRVLAPASSVLRFWGELSMELKGDPGERHSVTEVPASQSIPRREAPLKRCRASPGPSPSSRKGLRARLLLPAKGSQARVPPATTGASLQLRGLGLFYLQKLLHADQEICTPHSSVEASNHTSTV